jgi:hypothetical protein
VRHPADHSIDSPLDRLSLRSSAYLCVLCVEMLVNAENAEIRRAPQSNPIVADFASWKLLF